MKTILLLLLAIGMSGAANVATAQDTKYAKNYKICRTAEGYEVCRDQNVSNLNNPPATVPPERVPLWRQGSFISPVNLDKEPTLQQIPTEKALERSYPLKEDQKEENNRRNLNSGTNKYLPPSTGEIR